MLCTIIHYLVDIKADDLLNTSQHVVIQRVLQLQTRVGASHSKQYNSLPEDAVTSSDLNSFKQQVSSLHILCVHMFHVRPAQYKFS